MLFPSWEGWCTHAHSWGNRMAPPKKACSMYLFFNSMPHSSTFPVTCVFYICVCMSECEIMHSCTCGFIEISENTVNTAGPGSSNLGFSDSLVLFTCVVSSCRWTASVSIFILNLLFLSWHKHFVVLEQSICLLSERGLHMFKWVWGKTKVPAHPVG